MKHLFVFQVFSIYSFTLFFIHCCHSQTIVSGKITEAETGSPIPFANIYFVGTSEGGMSDFDGNFSVRTDRKVDSIAVRYIGYEIKSKQVIDGVSQVINFQLMENALQLESVLVIAGENPAWPILEEVVDNKKKNDLRSLDAYEYESYTKIEIDVDNISDKFRNRKAVKKIRTVLDSIQQIAGEDGQPILPIFISESLSRYYYRNDPVYKKENVIKTKLRGVGLTDGSTASQIIGSTLLQYNFYQNWLTILNKDFISPIAAGWKGSYHYHLADSLYLNDKFCYKIEFEPKRPQDLAFTGVMWITKSDYALMRIDATVPKSANLNYIEKIKIQQDLVKSSAGPWLPEKSRVVVDISQFTDWSTGFLAKFYLSAKDIKINDPKSVDFYRKPVTAEADMQVFDDSFWEQNRHDSLTITEQNVYRMIDTLRRLPFIKFYTDLGKFMASGYLKVSDKLDFGPYPTFIGLNNQEGLRLGTAWRTRIGLSRHFTLGGYYGYGFDDNRSKYRAYLNVILSRVKWTTLTFERQEEIEQVWLLNENIMENSFFYTFSRVGTLRQPFFYKKNRIAFSTQLTRGINHTIEVKKQAFQPLFDFRVLQESADGRTRLREDFGISEVSFSTQWGKDELFIIDDNQRVSLGTRRWPKLSFNYAYGGKGVFGGDFQYHKFKFSIYKRQKTGKLGSSHYQLNAGIILGDLPYPLLYNTLGNESPFYVNFAYNLMDYFEFSSDRYLELRYRHSFEGLLLNYVPLIRNFKWRLVANANVLFGGMKASNQNNAVDATAEVLRPFYTLGKKPYVELGYGVENIFKILRMDFFHRLSYLNHRPQVSRFGLKASFQLIL